MLKGVLNINKDSGLTSAAVVAKVRRILQTKAVGHMGTLDPQGTGVLIIGVGKATRLFDFYLKKDKQYIADFEFGYTTDTLDGDGIITDKTAAVPTKGAVIKALKKFVGNLDQLPPNYSAKSINGVRAYDLARQGKTPDLKTAKVRIGKFEFIEQKSPAKYTFKIDCSSGTYIRSLCRDLADAVGSLACMTSIHRTKSGAFSDTKAITVKELETLKDTALISIEEALGELQRIDFDKSFYDKISNGVKIECKKQDNPFAVYCNNELFGIGQSDGRLKITTFLKD